jgi:hypothetical protein
MMVEQLPGDAGVLGGNHVGVRQNLERANGHVTQIPYRRRDYI